ncbi:hypothetical protein JCM10908_003272 [Rhodotorula pacifica]|uniref:uncharacterized protein n=1 Tax=Rhodotorula pacifica TaxID=1495444 RepID=UPI00316B68E9
MLETFYNEPLESGGERPYQPRIPFELYMEHLVGRPVQGAEDGAAYGPIDIYIRPLKLFIKWGQIVNANRWGGWKPILAAADEAVAPVPIAGPCFLETVVQWVKSYTSNGRTYYKPIYGFNTVAATVAATDPIQPYKYTFHLHENGQLGLPPHQPAYEVQLRQLGGPDFDQISQHDPSAPVITPPPGAQHTSFACAITRLAHKPGDPMDDVHFRLIFDQNIPLWRDEYYRP